jgi:hypothetical protein
MHLGRDRRVRPRQRRRSWNSVEKNVSGNGDLKRQTRDRMLAPRAAFS